MRFWPVAQLPRRQRVYIHRLRSRSESALPGAADPRFQLDNPITATPVSPLGATTVGEAGTFDLTQCIVVAAVDGLSPFGMRHNRRDAGLDKLWLLMHNESVRQRSDVAWRKRVQQTTVTRD